MRKIIYTMLKKYPNEKIKTETAANAVAGYTNFLHGAMNLCGVCNTLSQNFVGTNNYPLLNGIGGFGTRINPTCSAPRYTRIELSKTVKTIINKNDEEIIGCQFFEGDYIEPQFFIPIFPILFLNGSTGLSTGFSQYIYPRNPSEIIEYIKKKISGIENPRMMLLPWFKGHLGKVIYNKELSRNESFGVITKNNMTSYTITELPIGVEYQKYVEFLDKLCDDGTIQNYNDLCDPKTDKILFNIKTSREFTKKHEDERKLYDIFHLVKSLPETLCCIDENNRVREFGSIQEILDSFIDIRLKYYNKRKEYILGSLKNDLIQLSSKYLFIKGVVDKTIIVSNKKKDDIVKQLEKIEKIQKVDESYDYLLRIPLYQLTKEKIDELKEEIKNKKAEYDKVKNETIENMWLEDLKELKKVLN